ncbi:hypothetical protein ACLB2K_055957 [Fragaria x ananassa]
MSSIHVGVEGTRSGSTGGGGHSCFPIQESGGERPGYERSYAEREGIEEDRRFAGGVCARQSNCFGKEEEVVFVEVELRYAKCHGIYSNCGLFSHGGGNCDKGLVMVPEFLAGNPSFELGLTDADGKLTGPQAARMGLIGPDSIFGPKKVGALTDGLTRLILGVQIHLLLGLFLGQILLN